MSDQYGNYQANLKPYPADPPAAITFTIPVSGDPNSLGTTTTTVPALAVDTVGDTLYLTTDGSTWTAISGGGGGGVKQVFVGTGNPNGVVSATVSGTQGFLYYDLATGIVYQKTGSGNTGWV